MKLWVGVRIVENSVTSLFEDALLNGCCNWDVLLSKAASITLLCSLCARFSDVLEGQEDSQRLLYLTWGDIDRRPVGGESIENLAAVITLRNEKGEK